MITRPLEDALVPLLWVHVFRYAPTTLFAPGQASPDIPPAVVSRIAYGDLASGLLALLALIALRSRWAVAIPLVWVANVFGMLDYAQAVAAGVSAQLYAVYIGWSWYILNFYTPMLVVTHALMVLLLVRSARS